MKSFIVMAIIFWFSSACCADSMVSNHDCLVVPHAKLLIEKPTPGRSAEAFMRMANNGHQIVAGNSTVVLFRISQDDNAGADAQIFSKITGKVASSRRNGQLTGELQVLSIFFTSGGVGFIQRGEYWAAQGFSPSIKLTYDGVHRIATIDAQFEVTKASDGTKKTETLHYSCPVRNASVGDLNEWEGKPSIRWNSFAPPSS